MIYTPKIQKAIQTAIQYHTGQFRKGKDVPYIIHPFGVGLILSLVSKNENIICAGILHDTLEDTDLTKENLKQMFGQEVFKIVNDLTEQNKSLPWAERKRLALEHVKNMSQDSILVKSADVLHNLTDQINDYKNEGEAMFKRFNASKDMQLERYTKLIGELEKSYPQSPLLGDLKKALNEVKRLWS